MPRLEPMRWPASWKDPSTVSVLGASGINCLLVEREPELKAVVDRASREGFQVADISSPPNGVQVVKGVWPQAKLSGSGAADTVSAGPTGNPWVDSNGWRIRLASALNPGAEVWVEAAVPKNVKLSADSYLIAIADAASCGGRWIISLDESLAQDIVGQKSEALKTWNLLTRAARFFAARQAWSAYLPAAVVGIISDFSGDNEFLSNEILNLVARTNQQYKVIPRGNVFESSFSGLRALLYPDAEAPTPDLRKRILAFVQAGGTLITGRQWGELPGTASALEDHPGYTFRVLGRGRLAVSKVELDDPYLIANDAAVLVSHRYELLRLWNPGAASCTFTVAPDRTRAALQMVFYASARVMDGPTVRVAGRYRSAGLWTLDRPDHRDVKLVVQKDAVELQLPRVTAYAGVELEA